MPRRKLPLVRPIMLNQTILRSSNESPSQEMRIPVAWVLFFSYVFSCTLVQSYLVVLCRFWWIFLIQSNEKAITWCHYQVEMNIIQYSNQTKFDDLKRWNENDTYLGYTCLIVGWDLKSSCICNLYQELWRSLLRVNLEVKLALPWIRSLALFYCVG